MRCITLGVLSLLACLSPATAQETRHFLVAPFLCTDGSPLPNLQTSSERYFHETTTSNQQQYEACATVVDAPMLPGDRSHTRQKCETFDITSYPVMCRGGVVSAARWWAASDEGRRSNIHIDGETLYVPLQGSSGWGGSSGGGITGLQIGKGSIGYVALPSGYGFSLNLPVQSLTLDWKSVDIPVTGTVPATIASAGPAPAWVQVFASWYPWPQLAIGLPLLGYGLIAIVGLNSGGAASAQLRRCLLALAAALIFLAFTQVPAGFPLKAQEAAEADLTRARAELAAVESDRADLARIIRISSSTGMVEPIAASDVQRIGQLMRPRHISTPRTPSSNPDFWLWLLLAPALAFPLFYILPFLRGAHFVFVPHPAAKHVLPAIEEQRPVWGKALAAALTPDPAQIDNPPAWWRSENLRKKAAALADKLRSDTDLAKAARGHASALAALKDAERELEKAKRKHK